MTKDWRYYRDRMLVAEALNVQLRWLVDHAIPKTPSEWNEWVDKYREVTRADP